MSARPIEQRVDFGELRYATCWEDAAVTAEALAPLQGARCLSIASAGDNTLSLLARGAAEIVAVDLSRPQLALLELKLAAFRALGHEELLRFLGLRPDPERGRRYAELRVLLGAEARELWDAQAPLVRAGVIHAGRLERYFALFRRCVLPLIHSRRTVAALLQPRSRAERERFYAALWDSWRWRALFRLFFSRAVMGRLGRDPEFFRHVEGLVAQPLLERTRRAFTALPAEKNPYLRFILTGGFGEALPDYLRPEHHAAIREGATRVRLVHAPVEQALAGLPACSIDAFNLSDVAEYMDLAGHHRLLEAVRRVAVPGARLAYWNLLAPRRRPRSMESWLEERPAAARRLHQAARTFFYRDLVLEVVR